MINDNQVEVVLLGIGMEEFDDGVAKCAEVDDVFAGISWQGVVKL